MGFGPLLFGYFAMYSFSISPYYFFADIIGALVAVYAFSKLAEYSRYFGGAMFGALGVLILSGVNAVSLLFGLYPMNGGIAWTAVEVLKLAAGCVMHVYMFLGTRTVAVRAGQDALSKKSVRCLCAVSLYYAAALIAIPVTPRLPERTGAAVSAGILLYWVLCLILNLLLLFPSMLLTVVTLPSFDKEFHCDTVYPVSTRLPPHLSQNAKSALVTAPHLLHTFTLAIKKSLSCLYCFQVIKPLCTAIAKE